MRTVADAIGQLVAYVVDDIPNTRREVELIVAKVLGVSTAQLTARLQDPLSDAQWQDAYSAIEERGSHKPMSHILGYRDFYKNRFVVTPDVLDPRPDTETLVELALAAPFSQVLDLGTGSGAILLSLLDEQSDAIGIGTDISELALQVATENADRIGVSNRVHFEQSDWFEAVGGTYDLIVSNPPYISAKAYETLAPELYYEPKIALTPGGDGLEPYRIITRDAPDHLTPGGRLLVEIGYDQGRAVSGLFRAAGLEDVQVHPDLNGKERVVSARARGI